MALLGRACSGYARVHQVVHVRHLAAVIAVIIPLCVGGCVAAPSQSSSNVVPDKAFQACLNSYHGQDGSADITPTQLGSLHGEVDCVVHHVVSIEGAQYLANITDLGLSTNEVSDLTPVSGLENLETLNLEANKIGDLTPLSGLKALTTLDLSSNKVIDVTPLSGLTSLTTLLLNYNNVSDLAPLSGLTDLFHLGLSYNQIGDLAPLSKLNSLTALELAHDQIGDVSPLAGLSNLRGLGLAGNQISDVTALAGLNVSVFDLRENRIADLSALGNWQDCHGGHSCELDATLQQVDLGSVALGTVPVPIVTTAGHEMAVSVTAGPAVINGDGTITYTSAGRVTLTWDTTTNSQSDQKFFSGMAFVTVLAQ
ncbi:MAG: leucine-rich repeat domain-containing protein [Propionibacteriaceae bacterium]|nr:leucine-rich repeat domain-containing protein [Propionibacteriaceae bacterium]